ncbi:MAG TPA: hypothetical protein ENK66_06975 [Arcobacter sp.]|nr:hypothetical protein [Arcobacter sp.]
MKVEFLKLAQQELDDAFEYYEYQQTDLGYRFVEEVYNAFDLIRPFLLLFDATVIVYSPNSI